MSLVKKYRFTTAFKVKIKIVIIISLFYFTKGQVALNKTYTVYVSGTYTIIRLIR